MTDEVASWAEACARARAKLASARARAERAEAVVAAVRRVVDHMDDLLTREALAECVDDLRAALEGADQ